MAESTEPGSPEGTDATPQGEGAPVAPSGASAPPPGPAPHPVWGQAAPTVAGPVQLAPNRPAPASTGGRSTGWWQGLLAGALAGALIGGGVAWAVTSANGSGTVVTSGGNVVINHPEATTSVTAAAAKALPSAVTISVTSSKQSGSGSGVILDTEGHILTNQHVATMEGSTSSGQVEVLLSDGRALPAKLVGQDPLYDLAVLKVDAEGLTPITWGDDEQLNVGDVAVAIGAPLGLPNSVSGGVVSNLDRSIAVSSSAVPEGEGQDENPFQLQDPNGNTSAGQGQVSLNVIQTDAAINHGNSGGALVNAAGELIGINVAIFSPSQEGGSIGLGFAVRGDIAQRAADEMIAHGKATHGQLGVTIQSSAVTADGRASAFTDGAKVASVPSGSPAGKAGMDTGDVIVKVGDRDVVDATDVTATVRSYAAGETVPITVRRGGSEKTLEVTLGSASAG